MDTFVEQIVKRQKQPLDWLIIAGVCIATLLLSWFVLIKISFLLPMLVLVLWGAWWLITNRNIEFEYSITNGEMDIDTIIAQRRRKRMCSITCAKVEAYGKLENTNFTGKKFDRTIIAAPSAKDKDNYYFIYRSKTHGKTLVIFAPDERVQQAFYACLPRLMQIEMEKQERLRG